MAKLSDDEKRQLDELIAKRDAPDEGSRGPNVNIHIDLSDKQAVDRAIAHGLLTRAEVDELKDDDAEDGDDGDEDEDEETEPAPTGRRRSVADRWAS